MGRGNGAFLQHIFGVISQRTLRGEMLDDYPLLLVGADFNEVALRVTRANLSKADTGLRSPGATSDDHQICWPAT